MRDVIIFGASGHAKVIADIVMKSGDNVVGFLDDNKTGVVFENRSVLGTVDDAPKFKDSAMFVIGIGAAKIRRLISEKFDLKWYTAIHPSAEISLGTNIGEGTVIMANAVINASVNIGKHCIVNTAAIIEHDSDIGNYAHISPRATLCGTVNIGKSAWVGAGAIIRNNVSVCDDAVIGCSSTVVKDITVAGTYIGTPAKLKKEIF